MAPLYSFFLSICIFNGTVLHILILFTLQNTNDGVWNKRTKCDSINNYCRNINEHTYTVSNNSISPDIEEVLLQQWAIIKQIIIPKCEFHCYLSILFHHVHQFLHSRRGYDIQLWYCVDTIWIFIYELIRVYTSISVLYTYLRVIEKKISNNVKEHSRKHPTEKTIKLEIIKHP